MIYRKCKKNKKLKNEEMIKRLQEINNYTEKKLDYLKGEIIDTNSIIRISNFKGNYINICFDDLKKCNDEKICSYKHLTKRNCKECIEESVYRFNNLYNKVKNKVNKYNQHINTIKDIIYLINKNDNLENTIVKFGLDKRNELICLFYDYTNILNDNLIKNKEIGTVYIVYGNLHKTKNKYRSCLRMNLRYDLNSIYIDQIHAATERMRCSHGTFALKNLECIINVINKSLKGKNIRQIKGEIKETKRYINRTDLVKFYKKIGFNIYNDSFFRKNIV